MLHTHTEVWVSGTSSRYLELSHTAPLWLHIKQCFTCTARVLCLMKPKPKCGGVRNKLSGFCSYFSSSCAGGRSTIGSSPAASSELRCASRARLARSVSLYLSLFLIPFLLPTTLAQTRSQTQTASSSVRKVLSRGSHG